METIKKTRLTFTEGSSDKEYNIQLVKSDKGFLVNFQYGRRNGTLQSGTKTTTPISEKEAEKIYSKLYREKTAKGYSEDGVGSVFSKSTSPEKESSGLLPQLLNAISERELQDYLNNKNYVIQPKKDGERRLVVKDSQGVFGVNRKGKKVSLPQEIVESINSENEVVLDGEIIGTELFVFDILSHNGKDLTSKPYSYRLQILEKIQIGENVSVVKTAYTKTEKELMLAKLRIEAAEGVVVKDLGANYSAGRPNSGGPALKYKFYKTATVKVKSLSLKKRSVQVSVYDADELIGVGSVTIPPNHSVPSAGDLVEVRYLYAYKGGCLYQPTYLGVREDLSDSDAKIEQLEYKGE